MSRRAFTLIELLIVVAIIAILAAIAVPNFLEAQTRARVSRTDNDLRTIELAMESYRIDNNGYPASHVNSPLPGHGTWSANDTRLLSTPIAYITEMPPDVFRIVAGLSQTAYRLYALGLRDNGSVAYYVYPYKGWMTWSHGPDQATESGGYRSYKTGIAIEALPVPKIYPATGGYNVMRYDPTNVTISRGDIHRWAGISKTM